LHRRIQATSAAAGSDRSCRAFRVVRVDRVRQVVLGSHRLPFRRNLLEDPVVRLVPVSRRVPVVPAVLVVRAALVAREVLEERRSKFCRPLPAVLYHPVLPVDPEVRVDLEDPVGRVVHPFLADQHPLEVPEVLWVQVALVVPAVLLGTFDMAVSAVVQAKAFHRVLEVQDFLGVPALLAGHRVLQDPVVLAVLVGIDNSFHLLLRTRERELERVPVLHNSAGLLHTRPLDEQNGVR